MLQAMGLRTGAVAMLVSVLWLGSLAASPLAHADGEAAVLYGHVLPDGDGQLPLRVRAISDDGIVCGTASVQPEGNLGVYAIRVATAAMRAGCPAEGDPVNLFLLYGPVDDGGLPASRAVMRTGVATAVDLARPSSGL